MPTLVEPTLETVPVPRVVGPDDNGLLLTPRQFDAIEDAERGYRYELIGGVLVACPPPGAGSRSPNERLGYRLQKYQLEHPEGSHLDATLSENYVFTGVGGGNRRVADRVIWCGLGRRPQTYGGDVPTIAVEFVSKTAADRRRDYVEKAAEYPAAGVKEYWIIDRFDRRMTIVRDGKPPEVIAADGTYATPQLPGFSLSVAELLAEADGWDGP